MLDQDSILSLVQSNLLKKPDIIHRKISEHVACLPTKHTLYVANIGTHLTLSD